MSRVSYREGVPWDSPPNPVPPPELQDCTMIFNASARFVIAEQNW